MKSSRTRQRRSRAPQLGALQPTPELVPVSLPLPVEGDTGVPSASPAPARPALVGPKCPNCGVLILNYLKRYCTLCEFPLPLAVRDPSKAALPPDIAVADDSIMRAKAVRIVLLRQAGMTDDEIAPIIGLKVATFKNYVYLAGRNGWLDDLLHDPKEQMDYLVYHKVVRRIDEALDSEAILGTGMPVRTVVALKVGDGTLFNRNEQGAQVAPPSTIVGVKIEIVNGEPQGMREGTSMGVNTYVDAETVEEPK